MKSLFVVILGLILAIAGKCQYDTQKNILDKYIKELDKHERIN